MFQNDENFFPRRNSENLAVEKSSQRRIRGILKNTPSDPSIVPRKTEASSQVTPSSGKKESEEDQCAGTGNTERKSADATSVEDACGDSDSIKHVMFADDCKCDLTEVQNFLSSCEDTELWSGCSYFQGKGLDERKSRDCSLTKEGFEREPQLVMCFNDPCTNDGFMEQFKERCVIIERCRVRDRCILGIILVRNLEKEKCVFVRYSTDQWTSCMDVPAKYIPNFSNDDISHFAFELEFPMVAMEMEFVVCCKLALSEYWDNNGGEKYKVQDIHQMIALEETN